MRLSKFAVVGVLGLAVASLGAAACDDDDSGSKTDAAAAAGSTGAAGAKAGSGGSAAGAPGAAGMTGAGGAAGAPAKDAGVADAAGPDAAAGDVSQTLFLRLGGEPAIRTVIKDFIGRVLADPKINGYFLNKAVLTKKLAGSANGRLEDCLVAQVSELTGGPAQYTAKGCLSMAASHKTANLGISMQDFMDLGGHLNAALSDPKYGVSAGDRNTIIGAVTTPAMIADIVQDATNNATIYQRLGRKPAITTVVGQFVNNVKANATINGFFGQTVADATRANRLVTCLVRQVCAATGGPCKFGDEFTLPNLDVGPTTENPCKTDMATLHAGMTNPQGQAGGRAITYDDFKALVDEFVKAVPAEVAMADKTAILGVLNSTCKAIVAGAVEQAKCP